MTENKRFMVDDAGTLIDMQTRDMFDIVEEVVDRLNELNEENIELHIQNDFLKDENQHMRNLVNENEQLRTALKELREIGDYQADRIQELNDENEQLKQLLDYADDLIQSYMSVHNRDEWENVKKNITGDVE